MYTLIEIAALYLKKSRKLRTIHITELTTTIDMQNYPSDWTFMQKVWHFSNDTTISPMCKICGKPCRFNSNAYWRWCSNKCMGGDPDILTKKQATNLTRYGTTIPQRLDKFREKLKQTNLRKFGVDNPFKSEIVKSKIKTTNVRKFGVDNPSKNKDVQAKIQKKALARNYDSILAKRIATNISNIGCATNKHIHLTKDAINKLADIDFLIDQHKHKSVKQIANELGCSPTPIYSRLIHAGVTARRGARSLGEIEVANFIKSIYSGHIIISDRKLISPQELDIYLPDANLAIEFNGVYWHSELYGKDRKYHLHKTTECNKHGVELFHIYDAEWDVKKEIIKSKIAGKLYKHDRIFARNTKFTHIDNKTKTAFLNNNHIQGNCASSINIGLMFNDKLVAVMTGGKSRFSKKYDIELLRFCTLCNTTVVGGASKLFKHFVYGKHISVVSYADLRWSRGNLYEKLGFEFVHNSAPNYKYFHTSNPSVLSNRIKFQKHKLHKLLDVFDPALTEAENMHENGYSRVWDCGNKVYKWNNK